MKKLFNDPYIDWNHKWRDFKFSLENRFSEADLIYAFYSGFIVFVILVARVRLATFCSTLETTVFPS